MRASSQAWFGVALSAVLTLGCGADAECVDQDGDGFGEHCERGPDCDDTDADLSEGCAEPDCDAQPQAQGCPCQGSAARACFSGPEEALAFGACISGTQYCSGGRYTACAGEVAPAYERCDDEDNDCDGLVDEGVRSPCGGCDVDCYGAVWGGPTAPFEAEAPLTLDARGRLTLVYDTLSFSRVWVANTDGQSASLVDGKALRELGRYALPGAPYRVATDYDGAGYFLSQAADGFYLTKVAVTHADCPGLEADALTSSGPDDVLPLGSDACVLFSVRVADADAGAMALAVDGTRSPDGFEGGDAWVASQTPPSLQRFSGETGHKLAELPLPDGSQPQDAAFALAGQLWVVDRDGILLRVDQVGTELEVTPIVVPRACYRLEALSIDAAGRLYLSTFDCESLISFEPSSERFLSRETAGYLSTRGVAAIEDALFVAHTSGAVSRVRKTTLETVDTLALDSDLGPLLETVGLSVSGDELWLTSRSTVGAEQGVLTRVDGRAMAVTGQLAVGLGPRALGDFTGARLLGSFAERGSLSRTFLGCEYGPTRFRNVHVQAELGPGAQLELRVRWAKDEAGLAEDPVELEFSLPADASPLPLDTLPGGGVIQVQATLVASDHVGAPTLQQVGVEWNCEAPE